jgi:hypothetical protein
MIRAYLEKLTKQQSGLLVKIPQSSEDASQMTDKEDDPLFQEAFEIVAVRHAKTTT